MQCADPSAHCILTKKEVTALSNSNNVKWVDSLISFEKRITKVEKFICTVWYALIIIMLVLQVVTRFILKSSIPWTDESARYLWTTLCFIGCGAAISEDAHIEINLIGSLISGMKDDEKKLKAARLSDIFRYIIVILIAIFLVIINWKYMLTIKKTGMLSSALAFPVWGLYLIIVIGFIGVIIHSLFKLIVAIADHEKILDPNIADSIKGGEI